MAFTAIIWRGNFKVLVTHQGDNIIHYKALAYCWLMMLCATTVAIAQSNDPEEIIVMASRQALPINQVGASVMVFTAADIQRRGILHLSDLFREVPGFAVSQSGARGTQTDIRIRGAEANHTLVLIDGIKVNDPSTNAAFDFGQLLASNIDRVEILRGPQGILWGSDAIGAVINIVTKKGAGPATINVRHAVGSQETYHQSANFNYRNSLFDINLNADILSTNGNNIAGIGNEYDAFKQRVFDIQLGLRPSAKWSLQFIGKHSNGEVQTDPQIFPNPRLTDAPGNATHREQTYMKANLRYTAFDDKLTQQFSIESTNINNDFTSSLFGPLFNDGKHIKHVYNSHLSLPAIGKFAIAHDISLILEHENDEASGLFLGDGAIVASTTKSIAAKYQIRPLAQLITSIGIRMQDNNLFDNVHVYQLNASYDIAQTKTKIKINYGSGIKNPTLFELYGNFPNFTGNPDLVPEQATGWDIGITQVLSPNSKINIIYFTNLISKQISGTANTVRNDSGTNHINGLELSLQTALDDHIACSGSYTYTDPRSAEHQLLLRRAQHIASVNCSYAPNNKLHINLGAFYNGEQIDTIFSDRVQRTVMGAYTLLNLAGQYNINDIFSLYARIDNLLDEQYEEIYGYHAPGMHGQIGIQIQLGG